MSKSDLSHQSATLGGDADFLERFTVLATSLGLPSSVARVFGYLLACQPPQQTSKEIQANLRLSAGAVNEAVNTLLEFGLVERSKKQSSRQYIYQIRPSGFQAMIKQRVHLMGEVARLAEDGLKLDPDNARLQTMQTVYSQAEVVLSDYLAGIEQDI